SSRCRNCSRKNGYFTARAGKIYHHGVPGQIGTSGLDDPPSWNKFVNPNGVDHTKEEALLTFSTPQRKALGSSVAYHASSESDEEHTDGMVAEAIMQMMTERRNEPWFLGAGFYLAAIEFMDAQVGKLLNTLERLKLASVP